MSWDPERHLPSEGREYLAIAEAAWDCSPASVEDVVKLARPFPQEALRALVVALVPMLNDDGKRAVRDAT